MKKIKYAYLTLMLIILTSTFFVINCSAEESKFGISLDLYDTKDEKIIDSSEDLILTLNIVNNYDYWVSIGGGYNKNPTFMLHTNDENVRHFNEFFADKIIIEPKSELKIYIPFDYYNNMKPDERLGTWELRPELTLNGFKLYEKSDQSKVISTFSIKIPSADKPIIGNLFEFTTKKQDVEVAITTKRNIIDDLSNYLSNWLVRGLLITVIGGITVGLILKKFKWI